jgi:hypothetical protein
MAIDTVTSAINRDWRRCQDDLSTLDDGAFSTDWWRGAQMWMKVRTFEHLWTKPKVFCYLDGPAPVTRQDIDTRTLEMLFNAAIPGVLLPP